MPPLRPYLRLVRAGALFSPIADVIAGLCIVAASTSANTVDWSLDAVRLMIASVSLYAAGMILNDHADREIDAKQRPERPIPRGQVAASTALALGIAGLAICLVASPVRAYHVIMVLLVLGYNYVIKSNAAAGAITMGTLRAMNLLAPCALVARGFDIDGAVEAGAGYALYIVAVTLLGILEDAPKVSDRSVLGLICVPPIVSSLVLLALPHRWPAAGIGLALAGCFLWRHRRVEWNQARIRGAMMWLLLGTMVYTSLIALGTGHALESISILAMMLVARVVARRISLT